MIMLLFCIYWKHDHWLSSILKDKNIRHVHTTCALYSRSDMFGKSWEWVNDDEPVIFQRKKLCFGLWCFPKHNTWQEHNTLYSIMGLESHLSGTVWHVFSPSHFPYEHLRCSWDDVLWSMHHVCISKKYSHDLFSDHKQLIS